MLYAFFWVILRRLNFICRRFGTLCKFHLHRQVGVEFYTYLPMKMEQSVPKRQYIKFIRRGITQKKTYNIRNTAKVWNQLYESCSIYHIFRWTDGTAFRLNPACLSHKTFRPPVHCVNIYKGSVKVEFLQPKFDEVLKFTVFVLWNWRADYRRSILHVKCTLVQALRLCTGRTAHRGSRGIALLFHDQRH